MQSSIEQLKHRRWVGCAIVTAAAILAFGADQFGMLSGVRTTLHDVLSPGRMVVLALSASADVPGLQPDNAKRGGSAETQALEALLRVSEQQRRQLIITNARMRNELRSQQTTQDAAAFNRFSTDSFVGFEAIAARVISRSGLPDRLRELIIDAGRDSNVTRSELIVDGGGLLIDRGTDQQVAMGARVLDGAVVVGRVAKVARWVSLVQPVDSLGFSSRVQLLRTTSEGVHFGAEGILAGTGEGHCVINGIPYTETVSVGDEVVSADIEGIQGPRLYFGRVTSAEFLSGGEWSVIVQPAMRMLSLQTVTVVHPAIDVAHQDRPKPNGGQP
jgi:rod shape-determining protein MreC